MQPRSKVITTNPRSPEATLDEFPDLFPAFEEPDIQFATSSYYVFKSIKFPKKSNVCSLDIGKRAVFECTWHTDSDE